MNKKAFFGGVLSLCLIFILTLDAVLVCGDNELPLEATAAVVEPCMESYGESIVASHRCIFTQAALGEPDGWGAWMLRRSWVEIELGDVVTGCSDVSIWTSKIGWGFASFAVYVSADGSIWRKVGSGRCGSRTYTRYDFSGAFEDVKYIKVKRDVPWRWSVMMLDAVMGERG